MSKDKNVKEITFVGRPQRCIYNGSDFKVYAFWIDKDKYPEIHMNKYKNVSVVGELHELTLEVEYEVKAIEEADKYGYSYKVQNIRRNLPTTPQATYAFLSEILTARQAKALYETYPDIVQRIKENRLDDIDLNKLKGIKEYTFNVIKKKIIENFVLADLIVEFQGYLNLSIVKKLYNEYSSIEKIKYELQKNPYKSLCNLGGIGFKTADSILLKIEEVSKKNISEGKEPIIRFDGDLRSSLDRCLAFVIYTLEENENEGNTKANLADVRKMCIDTVAKCADKFVEAIKSPEIYYNKETMDIALKRTYNTEKKIADVILENVNNTNNVWDFETEHYRNVNGFNLTDDQMKILDTLCKNSIMILNGSAGCVDCDTEFFTGTEWKRIADYQDGDKVLQYNEDGTAELVYPNAYIKNNAEYLWHFKTKNGLDQCLSDNHMCYYETRWGVRKKESFATIKEIHEQKGFTGKFLTSFKYSGTGIDLSDDEIRLMIAVFADGCYVNRKENNYVRINIKKKRKIERIISILNRLNKQYTVNLSKDGYTKIHFHTPFYAKHFPDYWYNCSYEQLKIIADEVMYWDGTFSDRERYCTSNKKDADFIQFVFSSVGYKAVIATQDRIGEKRIMYNKEYTRESLLYVVTRSKINKISMSVETRPDKNFGKTKIEKYKTKDGFEYCFNVPSHILILRRNNRIFITGNCGKSMSIKGIIDMLEDNKKTYQLLAPTGKSCKVICDFTKREAKTIHRGLQYTPSQPNPWHFNASNKLNYDVVIVDEFSMADIYLFNHLIDAIDFDKTKLLIVGDNAQLTSVGAGNLLHDFMESKIIPTVTLNQIFRYGEGGLMRVATDTRNCKPYLNSSMKSKATSFGSNKDYTFVDISDEHIPDTAVALYKKLLDKGNSVEDIQVLTAKNVGDCGTVVLNNKIQQVANPNYGSEINMKVGETTYYVGDLIMQKQNNYHAPLEENFNSKFDPFINEKSEYNNEEPKGAFIANGDVGKIIEIANSYVAIDFDGIVVRYQKEEMSMAGLSYCCSIHKSQGSSIKNVIVCSPQSHVFMLNSNLLYVALTRMRESCYQLGSIQTINNAVRKKANLSRNTFMQQLLQENNTDNI